MFRFLLSQTRQHKEAFILEIDSTSFYNRVFENGSAKLMYLSLDVDATVSCGDKSASFLEVWSVSKHGRQAVGLTPYRMQREKVLPRSTLNPFIIILSFHHTHS